MDEKRDTDDKRGRDDKRDLCFKRATSTIWDPGLIHKRATSTRWDPGLIHKKATSTVWDLGLIHKKATSTIWDPAWTVKYEVKIAKYTREQIQGRFSAHIRWISIIPAANSI